MRLSRFKLRGARLDLDSEQKIIDVPVDRGLCCHVGGQIDFDARGNLYLSTGDDTFPFLSDGYNTIDERPDRNPALDSQRSSGNTNDLRGKLLRIRPKEGGGYSVPAGNLFRKGTSRTRPEIYAMGLRNPFRFAVDRRRGHVLLADYSPDAIAPRLLRGPAGHGRWMVIRRPGNYGWPYCVTRTAPYFDYDFATGRSAGPFPCGGTLVNESPHNTGRRELPPVVQPDLWYPLTPSRLWPELGAGFGVGPMAGPAYDYRRAGRSRVRWPRHYDGVPLFYEWTRDYVREFRLDRSGALSSISPVLKSFVFDNPMDMEFGPDGALYLLEYGDGYNRENPEAQLSRIDFVRGGHTPVPKLAAQPSDGSAPLSGRVLERRAARMPTVTRSGTGGTSTQTETSIPPSPPPATPTAATACSRHAQGDRPVGTLSLDLDPDRRRTGQAHDQVRPAGHRPGLPVRTGGPVRGGGDRSGGAGRLLARQRDLQPRPQRACAPADDRRRLQRESSQRWRTRGTPGKPTCEGCSRPSTEAAR